MAEEEEAAAEVVAAREKVVLRGSTFDTHFEVGQIPVAGGVSFSSIILVGELDPRLVVCLPLAVWNGKVAQRLFPSKGLLKPVACSLACCDVGSREPIDGDIAVRAWFGFSSTGLEETINFGREEGPDHMFEVGGLGEPVLPDARAMVEVYNKRFNQYHTAESGMGDGGGGEPAPLGGKTDRMAKIEAGMVRPFAQEDCQPFPPQPHSFSWARGQNFLEASDGDFEDFGHTG